MQIRDYSLPAGWFPREKTAVSAFLSEIKADLQNKTRAAISPHAGWTYSGKIAALGAANLESNADTVVVLGGHLNAGTPPLFAMEDAVRTPFGYMKIDASLRQNLLKELGGAEDRYRDNTIEVLLPMVHYFFPEAQLLWLRLPAEISSYESGKIIAQIGEKLGRNVNVLASTDLTHYGENYGFSPKGRGEKALSWMRDVNDAAFIKAVESGDSEDVLRRAQCDSSSCSAGAVLGAMGFADCAKLGKARLLEYGTSVSSDDIPDSFVGYAAFAFGK